MNRIIAGFFLSFALAATLRAQPTNQPFFLFDKPDETIKATLLENPNFYDAGIASSKEGLWLAWLEFQPGKGDQLWIGLRGTNGWIQKTQLTTNAGDYANPTVTMDRIGRLWLSVERLDTNSKWGVFAQKVDTVKPQFVPKQITYPLPGSAINHRVTPYSSNLIFIAWQHAVTWQEASQRFQIFGRSGSPYGVAPVVITASKEDAWQPSVTTSTDEKFHVVYDSYDGASFNVIYCIPEGKSFQIASTPHFEAHAQIASDKNGKLWVSWEEDGENWGQRYVARLGGDKKSTRMTDKVGPLHRYRKLHLAQLDEKNESLTEFEIPQPSFELARNRTDAPDDLRNFGAFYENCQLVVDGQNRPWIVYRHFYVPWIGIVPETHKQDNMRLYARCLLTNGWSKLFSFDIGQGDGMQRISVSPEENGIAVAWTTGRTDRRTRDEREKNNKHRGVAIAEIKLDKAEAKVPVKTETRKLTSAEAQTRNVTENSTPSPPSDGGEGRGDEVRSKQAPLSGSLPARSSRGEREKTVAGAAQPRQRPSVEFRDKHYELFFGDLHRHTDISLCYSPVDGTIDDAYRYAIDAAPLDFLGITDHTHDLDWGEPLAQIWWRSRKEVDRHALAGRFIPFYSYERSRGDTDHNVISLRDDMLRPHTYPHLNFWQELDTNTFTIPHQPFNSITWNYHDDKHRPLMEIYQGYRDASMEKPAAEALARGHKIGFIVASDHLSTSASFSCVWAEKPTRESIFRAMQARRTYGATAKIILKVTCDSHWMGEEFELKQMKGITVKITPTATITGLELFMDGAVHSSVVDVMQAKPGSETTWEIPAEQSLAGKHTFYVRVTQADGNRAWSSPMWIDINP